MAVQKNFVVKNGIEINTNLIFGDTGSNKVGIATTNPRHTLHVNGGIGVTNLTVTGISTVNNLTINGRVSAGASLGAAGQYLISTGTGVTWGAVPTVRSTDLQTAGVGATTFNTTYTVGLLDVYVNGVKLSADEYTASNGATVVLDDACFGGETVEFISYSPFGIGVGGTSIQGITILEEGSPVGSALQVTSINFVGAAVTATGSGVGVTVYVNDSVNPNYWVSTVAGIHTLSNVGLGTTNPTSALTVAGDVTVTGLSTFNNTLAVLNQSGVAVLTVGHDVDGTGTDHLGIYYDNILGTPGIGGTASVFTSNGNLRLDVNDGTSNIIFGNGVSDYFTINGTSGNVNFNNFETIGAGVTVTGTTFTNQLSVSGITTSQEGFTSGIGVTNPVQITVSGNVLTFNIVGVGSTSLTLY